MVLSPGIFSSRYVDVCFERPRDHVVSQICAHRWRKDKHVSLSGTSSGTSLQLTRAVVPSHSTVCEYLYLLLHYH